MRMAAASRSKSMLADIQRLAGGRCAGSSRLPRLCETPFEPQRAMAEGCAGPTMRGMPVALRSYDPKDFSTLHKLDQACFAPGIAYSKMMLNYFLKQPSAECLLATEDSRVAGFILTESHPPLAHIITLDVAETCRRRGVGSLLLGESERNMAFRGVRTILLETAIDNAGGIAFWQRHGYRIEATLKRYYLGRLDAYEMRKILGPGARNPAKKET